MTAIRSISGVANGVPETPSPYLLHHWRGAVATDAVAVPQTVVGNPELALEGLPATGLGATTGWLTFNHATPATDTQRAVSIAGIDDLVTTQWRIWSLWAQVYEADQGKYLLHNMADNDWGLNIVTRVAGTWIKYAFDEETGTEYTIVTDNVPASPLPIHLVITADGATQKTSGYYNGATIVDNQAITGNGGGAMESAAGSSILTLGGRPYGTAQYCDCRLRDVHIYGGSGALPSNIGQCIDWLAKRIGQPIPARILS